MVDGKEVNYRIYIFRFLFTKYEILQEYNPYKNQILYYLYCIFLFLARIFNKFMGGAGGLGSGHPGGLGSGHPGGSGSGHYGGLGSGHPGGLGSGHPGGLGSGSRGRTATGLAGAWCWQWCVVLAVVRGVGSGAWCWQWCVVLAVVRGASSVAWCWQCCLLARCSQHHAILCGTRQAETIIMEW